MRRVSQAWVAVWAAEELESESGAKWNNEIPDMGDPPVFWGRSRSTTRRKRRCEMSRVARVNYALVASTSALRW